MRIRKFLKFAGITLAVLIVLGYGYSKSRDLIFGTEIIIESPIDGETLSSPLVTVRGSASQVSKLLVNGKLVLTDEAGNFSKMYVLAPGYNVITVSAIDRFDRELVKNIRVNYEGEELLDIPVVREDIDTVLEDENTDLGTSTQDTPVLNGTSTEESSTLNEPFNGERE